MNLLKNLVKTCLILLIGLTLVNCSSLDHKRSDLQIVNSQVEMLPEFVPQTLSVGKVKVVDENICFQSTEDALAYENILKQRDYLDHYASLCYTASSKYYYLIKTQEAEIFKMNELIMLKDDMIEAKNDQIKKERYTHFTIESILVVLLILL